MPPKFVLLVWYVTLSLFTLVTWELVTLITVRVCLAVKLRLWFISSVRVNCSFYFVHFVYEFCNKYIQCT